MAIARTLPTADGTDAYTAAVILGGPSAGASTFKRAPIAPPGQIKVINLPAGNTVLTMAMIRSGARFVSTSPGSTSLFVPRLQDMAGIGSYVFDPDNPVNGLFFAVQRRGLGLLAVNFDTGNGVVLHGNDVDPSTRPRWAPPTGYELVGVNEWTEG